MEFFPLLISLENKPCLIVGGGLVAERKIETIIEANPVIEVVSPNVTSLINDLHLAKKIILHKREFRNQDIEGKFIVFAATNNAILNEKIAKLCIEKNIIVNCVKPGLAGNCIMPSFSSCDGLIVSVSTMGQFPMLAKKLREEMEKRAEIYRKLLNILIPYRERLLTLSTDYHYNKKLWLDFFRRPILQWIEEGQMEKVEIYIKDFFSKLE